VLLKLRGHPSIVGLVGFTPPIGDARTAPIFMQLATGGSLADVIHNPGTPPTTRAKWAVGIALGMRFCHKKQVIHRDLKPGNVLLDDHSEVMIADFGSSKNEQTMTSMSRVAGTLYYVAPEVTEIGADYDETVDVYSYGIVLWEIIKGIAPYKEFPLTHGAQEGNFLRAVKERAVRPNLDGIKDWVKDFLKTLWDGNPSIRPTFDGVLTKLASKDYAIVDGVDKAAVQDYRNRIEAREAH
jgi:serine/threonine protein kinase